MLKKNDKVLKYTLIANLIVLCLLLIAMIISSNVNNYKTRVEKHIRVIDDYSYQLVNDENTPLGVKKIYSFNIKDIDEYDNILDFYVVHHYIKVYLDDELLYEAYKDEGIGKTIGSRWVIVPISSYDNGKTITVELTPIYKSVLNKNVEFIVGNEHSIFSNIFREELVPLLLSFVALMLGIIILILPIYYSTNSKSFNFNIINLGVFSFLIGIWKLFDSEFITYMFDESSLFFSYVSLGALYLAALPLLLYVRNLITKIYKNYDCLIILNFIVNILIFVLQLFNILDLRQVLNIVHIIFILDAILTFIMMVYDLNTNKNSNTNALLFLIVIFFGLSLDVFLFYFTGKSSNIIFVFIAFFFYIVTSGLTSVSNTTIKANTDMHTGLYNKSRCNEVLSDDAVITNTIALLMFDLNSLKVINDTYGHEMGDKVIVDFAKMIKSVAGKDNFIGRFGGDEFIVIFENTNKTKVEKYILEVEVLTNIYNSANKVKISYAVGYSISSDYEQVTLKDLLRYADQLMYENKKHNK